MLKKRSTFERLISLLQGASWALVLIGAISFFFTLYPFGFFIAIVGAFLGSLGGLFFVVIFEIANLQIEKLDEIKKQTKLLERLVDEKISHN
ncbi:hypothetical protein [Sulfurospirillum arcachonense]|uniref:hypothetical protein n=1 Tax=Sulfurospirillum arcachonense TaxID=57666 RepID=UPI00046AC55D|nr:hypothetical protein [Sulfurospirillum arcachonense]